MSDNSMDSLNAKRMTADQVASTFVVPAGFERISSQDNVYVIGPRGSGKTTLLRMLTDQSLLAWQGHEAEQARRRIRYSSVFVPADELWASQASMPDVRAAFSAQLMLAVVETMAHRTSGRPDVHIPASLSPRDEAQLATHLGTLWGIQNVAGGFVGLQAALEVFLADIPRMNSAEHPLSGLESLRLVVLGLQAFNRAVRQAGHRWALLLDEMELAPAEVHGMVTAFVRGGSPIVSLKISMSPFDRYMEYYGDEARPAPGHDFQTVYLSGQSSRDLRTLTYGLWAESLRARGLPHQDMPGVLADREYSRRDRSARDSTGAALVPSMAGRDDALREWLLRRNIDPNDFSRLDYLQRSATIRKITPLLVYRDALLNFRHGNPVLRSRKKSYEPFTGANAVVTILEGNPRWIKSAFSQMLDYYDTRKASISQGFQLDALQDVANRFEALLRVLPARQGTGAAAPPLQLVDTVARYLRERNLGQFSADAPNSFIVDRRVPPEIEKSLLMALYAGAIVHLRDRKSPAVLSSFANQRFRLTHLLSVRDGKELPLRRGKDVNLSSALGQPRRRIESPNLLPIDWTSYESQ